MIVLTSVGNCVIYGGEFATRFYILTSKRATSLVQHPKVLTLESLAIASIIVVWLLPTPLHACCHHHCMAIASTTHRQIPSLPQPRQML